MERRTLLTGFAAIGAATLIGCSSDDDQARADHATPSKTPTTTQTTAASVNPKVASTIATGLNVPWGIVFLDNGDALVSQRDEGRSSASRRRGKVTKVGDVKGASGGARGRGRPAGHRARPRRRVHAVRVHHHRLGRPGRTPDARRRLVSARRSRILTGIAIGVAPPRRSAAVRPRTDTCSSPRATPATVRWRRTGTRSTARSCASTRTARRPPATRSATAPGPTGTATSRAWPSTPTDGCGPREFGDKAARRAQPDQARRQLRLADVEGKSDNKDFVNPKVTWGTDECSPAGLAITRSTAFLGALQGECLFAVPLDGEDAGKPKAYFGGEHGRIRSVATAPDGALWVTTSNTDGRGDLPRTTTASSA